MTTIAFTQISNDINGNPRYVCPFYELLTEAEKQDYTGNWLARRYRIAVKRANKIGGRKYHNKQYGGGIVFTSYNPHYLELAIKEYLANQ